MVVLVGIGIVAARQRQEHKEEGWYKSLFPKHGAKIVQGERKGERKAEDFLSPLPSRSLFYLKIVQGERKGERKAEDFLSPLPSRSLFG